MMSTDLNLRCVQCDAPLSNNEPTAEAPGGGEICWNCQQPEEFRRMSEISAEPVLMWARRHFAAEIARAENARVLDSPAGYARFCHLRIDFLEHKYAVQRLDGSIEEISEEVYRSAGGIEATEGVAG